MTQGSSPLPAADIFIFVIPFYFQFSGLFYFQGNLFSYSPHSYTWLVPFFLSLIRRNRPSELASINSTLICIESISFSDRCFHNHRARSQPLWEIYIYISDWKGAKTKKPNRLKSIESTTPYVTSRPGRQRAKKNQKHWAGNWQRRPLADWQCCGARIGIDKKINCTVPLQGNVYRTLRKCKETYRNHRKDIEGTTKTLCMIPYEMIDCSFSPAHL